MSFACPVIIILSFDNCCCPKTDKTVKVRATVSENVSCLIVIFVMVANVPGIGGRAE